MIIDIQCIDCLLYTSKESDVGLTIDRIVRNYDFDMPHKHVHEEYEIYYLVDGERYY